MTKLEFEDSKRNYGYVEITNENFDWKYEGDFNIIYEHIFSQIDAKTHIRPENVEDSVQVDELVDCSPNQKIRSIKQRFHNEGKVFGMRIDGEIVYG